MMRWSSDDLLNFAEFGLDRILPEWVRVQDEFPILHLGPGRKRITLPRVDEIDVWGIDYPEYDLEHDRLPIEDNSCGGIVATHVLEHLADPRWVLREASRVLAPGAPMNILVPHADSIAFKQDLDHKKAFVLDTWKNFLDNHYYDKDRGGVHLRVGVNISFAVKDGNEAIITQLIKDDPADPALTERGTA